MWLKGGLDRNCTNILLQGPVVSTMSTAIRRINMYARNKAEPHNPFLPQRQRNRRRTPTVRSVTRLLIRNKNQTWVSVLIIHDYVTKWKRFYWPVARGIHWSLVDSPHNGKWRGALMFSLICAGTNVWENNRDTGDVRHHRDHYEVTVMTWNFNDHIVGQALKLEINIFQPPGLSRS